VTKQSVVLKITGWNKFSITKSIQRRRFCPAGYDLQLIFPHPTIQEESMKEYQTYLHEIMTGPIAADCNPQIGQSIDACIQNGKHL